MKPTDNIAVAELLDASPHANRETIDEHSPIPQRFFRLDCDPFSDNVNPGFFFRTEAHENAFISMRRCIEENISLGLTTAISGTGKTLLTQVLIQELEPERYRPALVLIYPDMSRTALLKEICTELGIANIGTRPTMHQLVNAIQQEIMSLYLKGIKLVVIIDEAHFLNSDNLQILRTLSNIEIPERKLVTVLLFGEDSFNQKLDNPKFKSILSRMFTRVALRPLTRGEVEQYVKFRILMANGRPSLFASNCFDLLFELSGGIPREINRICHNALQRAASKGLSAVSPDLLSIG
jgi:general secretion pathway protein A